METTVSLSALARAARVRTQPITTRRPDRLAWRDRRWELAALRFSDSDVGSPAYGGLDTRDRWFFDAAGPSPATMRRSAGAGSVYWLARRDRNGLPLRGEHAYELRVPQPVPGKLFWSITVYDAETNDQIQTSQSRPALRSLFELRAFAHEASLRLYFGPDAPAGLDDQWIQTIPDKAWFAYLRVYGPESSAFDGSWKPGDFERVG